MRALCGAIITAGALIGLGLAAVGVGMRYQGFHDVNQATGHLWGAPSLAYITVGLFIGLGIGLGVAFVGLMYHHERRERERFGTRAYADSTGVRS
jgi:hypothetical protein